LRSPRFSWRARGIPVVRRQFPNERDSTSFSAGRQEAGKTPGGITVGRKPPFGF